MKWLIPITIALLFLKTPALAQDRADQAIKDAMALIEARQKEMTDANDIGKTKQAIEQLQLVLRSSQRIETRRVPVEEDSPSDEVRPRLNVSIADFIDHTEKYRGQVITLPLTVRSIVLANRGHSLRDLIGGPVRFLGLSDDGNRLDMTIDLPAGLEVPKASFADRLIVTFRCGEGDLQRGNQAIRVQRPSKDDARQSSGLAPRLP